MSNVQMTNLRRANTDAGLAAAIGHWNLGIHRSLFLLFVSLLPSLYAGDWPQWRGPTRAGYPSPDAPEVTSLPKELKPVWKIPVGGGFSSPVVAGGRLVYLDEVDGKEVAHLLEA